MPKANVIVVRDFINLNSARPTTMQEMNEFWKSLTDEEKTQYANEARALAPQLDPA